MIIASFPKGSYPEYTWPIGTWPEAPEGADIQYTEVMEFSVAAILSAPFTAEMPMVIDAEIKNVTVSIGAEQTGAEYGTAIYGVDYYGSSLIIPIGVIFNVVLTLSLRILKDKAIYYSELSKEVVE